MSFIAAASEARFSDRYFLQLLPVLAVTGAHGAGLAFAVRFRRRLVTAIAAIALAVPLVRFGSRYVILAGDLVASRESNWSDSALDRDSHAVSAWISAHRQGDDTLFVWGYRPDLFAYIRMPAASVYWDSQPLAGVPADRHLTESAFADSRMGSV